MSMLLHPPSSFSTARGVPFITCQLAQMCRRSCQVQCSMPARASALLHAVLIDRTGWLRKVKIYSGCCPISLLTAATAASDSGTPIDFPLLVSSAATQATRRRRSTCRQVAEHICLAQPRSDGEAGHGVQMGGVRVQPCPLVRGQPADAAEGSFPALAVGRIGYHARGLCLIKGGTDDV